MCNARRWPLWMVGVSFSLAANAQTIERVKLTDNDLSCTQIYAESMQMEALAKGGMVPGTPVLTPEQQKIIEAQAIAAGQKLSNDPQVMALSQQYAAKAQAGTLTQQEQLAYAQAMLNNPNVQSQLNSVAQTSLGQISQSGALPPQAASALGQMAPNFGALAAQGANMAAAQGGNPTMAIMNANGLTRQDLAMAQQLMLQSPDVRVRAAATDPQQVAQYAAMIRNPQLAVAAQRAAAAGVNPAAIQNQLGMVAGLQQAAGGGAAAPAASPQANALSGLFGALANRGGASPNNAAGLFGALAGAATQQAAAPAAPAPALTPLTPAPAVGGATMVQAQARKEHLTSLFLQKGCKLSDIKR